MTPAQIPNGSFVYIPPIWRYGVVVGSQRHLLTGNLIYFVRVAGAGGGDLQCLDCALWECQQLAGVPAHRLSRQFGRA